MHLLRSRGRAKPRSTLRRIHDCIYTRTIHCMHNIPCSVCVYNNIMCTHIIHANTYLITHLYTISHSRCNYIVSEYYIILVSPNRNIATLGFENACPTAVVPSRENLSPETDFDIVRRVCVHYVEKTFFFFFSNFLGHFRRVKRLHGNTI